MYVDVYFLVICFCFSELVVHGRTQILWIAVCVWWKSQAVKVMLIFLQVYKLFRAVFVCFLFFILFPYYNQININKDSFVQNIFLLIINFLINKFFYLNCYCFMWSGTNKFQIPGRWFATEVSFINLFLIFFISFINLIKKKKKTIGPFWLFIIGRVL